jgi:hypothetical protein
MSQWLWIWAQEMHLASLLPFAQNVFSSSREIFTYACRCIWEGSSVRSEAAVRAEVGGGRVRW